jgi:hypothetical protein
MQIVTLTNTAIDQQSVNSHDCVVTESVNSHDDVTNISQISLEALDETEFELERIMFEEFAHGLPSDIPMAGF